MSTLADERAYPYQLGRLMADPLFAEQAYQRLRAQTHSLLGITDPKAPKAPPAAQVGDKATCSMCGRPIVSLGADFWKHEGEHQPRHPATPAAAREPSPLDNF